MTNAEHEIAARIHQNRQSKADALVTELDKLLARVAKATGQRASAAEVVETLRRWGDLEWTSLAILAGKRPPKTSRPLVIAEFVRRSKESV